MNLKQSSHTDVCGVCWAGGLGFTYSFSPPADKWKAHGPGPQRERERERETPISLDLGPMMST